MAARKGDDLATLVKRFRARAKISQEVLSQRTGGEVSESLISHVENGRRNLGHDRADRIADALELSDDERAALHEARRTAPRDVVRLSDLDPERRDALAVWMAAVIDEVERDEGAPIGDRKVYQYQRMDSTFRATIGEVRRYVADMDATRRQLAEHERRISELEELVGGYEWPPVPDELPMAARKKKATGVRKATPRKANPRPE